MRVPETVRTPRWRQPDRENLSQRLNQLAADTPGRWSFAVAEQGPVATVNARLVHPAASTIKLPLLMASLAEVTAGRRQLDETLEVPDQRTGGSGMLAALDSVRQLRLDETLTLMIAVSDNTATNMVIDLLGLDNIPAHLSTMGLAHTRLRRHMLDQHAARSGRENVATADELTRLLDRLGGGELVSTKLRDQALRMLGRQQINDRIPAYLDDVVCLHKTGELPQVRHDAGLLCFDGRSIAFSALASDLPNTPGSTIGSGPAAQVIGSAAQTVVQLARRAPG